MLFDGTKEGEKDSLALQALKTGELDFADPRVNIQAASADSQLTAASHSYKLRHFNVDQEEQNQAQHQFLEVELGDLTSLGEN